MTTAGVCLGMAETGAEGDGYAVLGIAGSPLTSGPDRIVASRVWPSISRRPAGHGRAIAAREG